MPVMLGPMPAWEPLTPRGPSSPWAIATALGLCAKPHSCHFLDQPVGGLHVCGAKIKEERKIFYQFLLHMLPIFFQFPLSKQYFGGHPPCGQEE